MQINTNKFSICCGSLFVLICTVCVGVIQIRTGSPCPFFVLPAVEFVTVIPSTSVINHQTNSAGMREFPDECSSSAILFKFTPLFTHFFGGGREWKPTLNDSYRTRIPVCQQKWLKTGTRSNIPGQAAIIVIRLWQSESQTIVYVTLSSNSFAYWDSLEELQSMWKSNLCKQTNICLLGKTLTVGKHLPLLIIRFHRIVYSFSRAQRKTNLDAVDVGW